MGKVILKPNCSEATYRFFIGKLTDDEVDVLEAILSYVKWDDELERSVEQMKAVLTMHGQASYSARDEIEEWLRKLWFIDKVEIEWERYNVEKVELNPNCSEATIRYRIDNLSDEKVMALREKLQKLYDNMDNYDDPKAVGEFGFGEEHYFGILTTMEAVGDGPYNDSEAFEKIGDELGIPYEWKNY